MAFIMDLQECGYEVELLIEGGKDVDEKFGWQGVAALEVLKNVRWHQQMTSTGVKEFNAVFVFSSLTQWLKGVAPLNYVFSLLSNTTTSASLMIDETPFAGCINSGLRPTQWCRTNMPEIVSVWMTSMTRVFTLTKADALQMSAMLNDMRSEWKKKRKIDVWPLRLRHLTRLKFALEEQRKKVMDESKFHFTVVADRHKVNQDMTNRMFEGGMLEKLCAIANVHFVGNIKGHIEILMKDNGKFANCVRFNKKMRDAKLVTEVLSKTLAIVNPFFYDVGTGISVRSYEAIAAAIPVITSDFGLRGLEACGDYAFGVKNPDADNVKAYMLPLSGTIGSPQSLYQKFMSRIHRYRVQCVLTQEQQYPMDARCKA